MNFVRAEEFERWADFERAVSIRQQDVVAMVHETVGRGERGSAVEFDRWCFLGRLVKVPSVWQRNLFKLAAESGSVCGVSDEAGGAGDVELVKVDK